MRSCAFERASVISFYILTVKKLCDMEGREHQKDIGDKSIASEQHMPFVRLRSKSGCEYTHYSLLYEGFPDEFQAIAEEELKETPEARKIGLQKLREYMKSHDMPPLKDDLTLLAALRNCKYDVKKAELKLKKWLNMRHSSIEELKNLGMEKIERIVDDTPFWMCPYRDRFGRAIINTRPRAIKEEHYSISEVATVVKAGFLFQLCFPITTVSGIAYFGDCSVPSCHMYYYILKEVRSMLDIVFTPIRLARVELLNENSVYRSFINLIKPLLGKKIISRFTFHGGSLEQIHEMYSPDLLPEEYGGNAGPISSKPYREKFLHFIGDLINEDC